MKRSTFAWIASTSVALAIGGANPVAAKTSRIPIVDATALQDIVEYGVRKGDNLFALARQSLVRPESYRAVQRLNQIADPHRIPVGTILRIPVNLLKADPLVARIVAVRGNVMILQAGRQLAPSVGSEIAPGAAIETGSDGFVTLQLPNGSRTSMPTRTRMRITRLHRIALTGSIDYDFAVEGGKVETTASPLGKDRNNRFRIRTPRAITAVRGTRFRVGFGDDASLAEVLEGTVAASSEATRAQASLTEGLGAVVSASGDLATENLLAAPDLLQPGRVQTDPLVKLALASLPGARGYHVQISEDAGFAKVLAEQTGAAADFTFADIPNGSLFVRVSGIAGSGLEGLPQTFAMRRVLAGVTASAQADADAMRFSWSGEGAGQRSYSFQLGPKPEPGQPDTDARWLVNEAGLQTGGVRLRDLPPGVYRWRVGVRQDDGTDVVENWLPFEQLTVAAPE